jgi:DNA-binding response OmpR family regulator
VAITSIASKSRLGEKIVVSVGVYVTNSKVLIIDDDQDISKLLLTILTSRGLRVFQAFDGKEGMKMAYEIHPDLIILDIMMPALDGWDVCRRLREVTNVPILMVTALAREEDLIRGFSTGADDYVKKPFSRAGIEARVFGLFRRKSNNTGKDTPSVSRYTDEVLDVDLETRSVRLNGNDLELSSLEYDVLACLIRNLGKTVPHQQILQEVWGKSYGDLSSTVTLYMYYLRKKLEDDDHGHQYLRTQWGRGYIFMPRHKELPSE